MSVSTSEVTTADVMRGSAWGFASTVIPQTYTFAISIVVARSLGAEGVGLVAFIAFVETTLVSVLVIGLPTAYMRFVGETMGQGRAGMIRSLTRSIANLIGLAAALGAGALLGVALLGGEPRWAWIFAAIACAGAILHTLPSAFLTGVRRWRDAVIVGLTTGALGLVAKVVALASGGDVTSLFAVDAAVVWLNVLGTWFLAHRAAASLLPSREPAGDLTRRTVKFALIGSISLIISLVLYRRTEILFLQHYSTTAQVALYSIPFSIVVSLIMLPRAIVNVVAPTVATLHGAGDTSRIRSGYGRSLRVVLLFGSLATAGAIAVGPSLVTLLYGREFEEAGTVLVILLATVPFVPLMAIAQSVLLGIGKQWVPNAIVAVAAAANIGLDLLLIPRYHATGAAVANSVAQILAAVPFVAYASICLGGARIVTAAVARGIFVAAIAGVAAGGVVAVLPDALAVPLAAVVFLVVAVPLTVLFRAISIDDARWLGAALGPRRAAPLRWAVRAFSRRQSPWMDDSR